MIKQLRLTSYKAFKKTTINFGTTNILIGPNNAGKSTIMECLSLVAQVNEPRFYRTLKNLGRVEGKEDVVGCHFDPKEFGLVTTNLRHKYYEKTAEILARFEGGLRTVIRFPVNGPSYVKYETTKGPVIDFRMIGKTLKTKIGIVPPVGPLEDKEKLLTIETLRKSYGSHLTPRHFRNYLYNDNETYRNASNMIQEYFPEIMLRPPNLNIDDRNVYFDFREGDSEYELGWAGTGLQVFIQLVAHLSKLREKEVIVLDEPDVFLHSDLQRRLAYMLTDITNQLIVATHSVDIINEFPPESILTVDKESTKSRSLASHGEVQNTIEQLGSLANVKTAALLRSNTVVFVEGNDYKLLQIFAEKVGTEAVAKQRGFVTLPIDGFSNWRRLLHIDWLLKNATNHSLNMFLVLDSDFHCNQEIEDVKQKLRRKKVRARIWKRKEIENYTIIPEAIVRLVNIRIQERAERSRSYEPLYIDIEWVIENLTRITDSLKFYTLAQLQAGAIKYKQSNIDNATVLEQVQKDFELDWVSLDKRLELVGGKEIISELNRKLKSKREVNVTAVALARELNPEEIDGQVKRLVRDIDAIVKIEKE